MKTKMVHAASHIKNNVGSEVEVTTCRKENGKKRALDGCFYDSLHLSLKFTNGFLRLDFEADKLRTNAALSVMAALRVMVAELWLKSNWTKLRTQNTRDTFFPANRDEISHVNKN